jgi:hypothetical protein
LALGPGGKIRFALGPEGSFYGPENAQTKADVDLAGEAAGAWTLEKDNTRLTLPRDGAGRVQEADYFENVDREIWSMLVAPGCSTLTVVVRPVANLSTGPVVEKSYRLCDVQRAADALRK